MARVPPPLAPRKLSPALWSFAQDMFAGECERECACEDIIKCMVVASTDHGRRRFDRRRRAPARGFTQVVLFCRHRFANRRAKYLELWHNERQDSSCERVIECAPLLAASLHKA